MRFNRKWWDDIQEPVPDYVAAMPPHPQAAGQERLRASLASRYPGAPIYQAMALEAGYDPLRAVELAPDA